MADDILKEASEEEYLERHFWLPKDAHKVVLMMKRNGWLLRTMGEPPQYGDIYFVTARRGDFSQFEKKAANPEADDSRTVGDPAAAQRSYGRAGQAHRQGFNLYFYKQPQPEVMVDYY